MTVARLLRQVLASDSRLGLMALETVGSREARLLTLQTLASCLVLLPLAFRDSCVLPRALVPASRRDDGASPASTTGPRPPTF